MPYFGLLSFLRIKTPKGDYTTEMFQCPTSGFFLFYTRIQLQKNSRLSVSMPYFGLLSFLLPRKVVHYVKPVKSFNALLRASFFSTLCFCSH